MQCVTNLGAAKIFNRGMWYPIKILGICEAKQLQHPQLPTAGSEALSRIN
jgi:hypothetical protein